MHQVDPNSKHVKPLETIGNLSYNLDFHMLLHIESEKPKKCWLEVLLEIGIARVNCLFPAIGDNKIIPGWHRSCKWPVIVGIRFPLTFNPLLQYLQKDIPYTRKNIWKHTFFFWGGGEGWTTLTAHLTSVVFLWPKGFLFPTTWRLFQQLEMVGKSFQQCIWIAIFAEKVISPFSSW